MPTLSNPNTNTRKSNRNPSKTISIEPLTKEQKTMTGEHQILQTKLKELETILEEALLRGQESDSHEDIKTKLAFIRTLLSTEVASSDSTKPHHLLHMSDRLVSLEKSFHEWDSQRLTTSEDFEKDNSTSSCSCTESCFNDDGEETLEGEDSGMTIYDNPLVDDSWSFDDEKAIVEFRGNGVGEICGNERERFNLENDDKLGFFVYEDAKDEFFEDFVKDNKEVVEMEMESEDSELGSEEGNGKCGIWKNCCSMASGVVIGMILMSFIMVNFSDCFYYYDDDEQASFSFPT